MSRPITESRMASTTSCFFLPTNLIRAPTMSTTSKAKRRCCSSFFITDILAQPSRSSSPDQKRHLPTAIEKDSGDEDETLLHDSEDNGKTKDDCR